MDSTGTTGGPRLVAGRYRLLGAVGSGGMGTVWRAEDERLGRLVAVKEVRPPVGMSEPEYADLRERTLREARAAARLSTPGAVAVHDVVESDGRPWVVMELLHGRSLAAVVAEDGPLAPAEVARVGLSLLRTLAAAHEAGILHRDVKPANVVLTDSGRVVLTDFGIAKTAGDPQLTSTGVLLGSPAYIAPERARGREAGPASDLYALGATLFTAVEGRPPFTGPDAMATLMAVAAGERQPAVAAGPLAPALDALLDPDPARRPDARVAETLLRPALEPAAPTGPPLRAGHPPAPAERTLVVPVPVPEPQGSGPPGPAPRPRPSGDPSPGRRPSRRHLPLLAVLALLAVVGVGAAVALSDRGDDPGGSAGDAAAPAGTGATGPEPTAGTEPGTTAPPTPPPTSTAPGTSPSPTQAPATDAAAAQAPEGWGVYADPGGWSIAHPPGWEAGARDVRGQGVVQITSPDAGSTYIRVSDDGTAGGDPVERWRAFAAEFAARNPSYQEEGIEAVEDYRYTPAADWEFSYDSGGQSLHVVDRMLFTPDGRAYAVLVQGPDDDDVEALFTEVVESFRPAGV